MSPLGRLPNFGALTLLGLVYCSQAGAAPSYQSINRSFSNGPNGSFDGMSVDINRDGIGDVSFKHVPAWGTGLPLFYSEESVIGTNGAVVAQVGAQPQSFAKADAIGPAEFVGPHLNWTAPGTFEAQINGFNGNPEFVNPDTSIGVRLMITGEPHYAWVRVRYIPGEFGRTWAVFNAYDTAWETTPNTPIRTPGVPEPAVLGWLTPTLLLLCRRQRRVLPA